MSRVALWAVGLSLGCSKRSIPFGHQGRFASALASSFIRALAWVYPNKERGSAMAVFGFGTLKNYTSQDLVVVFGSKSRPHTVVFAEEVKVPHVRSIVSLIHHSQLKRIPNGMIF